MNNAGKVGCGCLLFILICCMVIIGLLIHPATLKFIGNQFRYEDKIFASDALLVPRFVEDKNGDLYIDAFREFWAGNGKTIIIEDDRILGVSIIDFIFKMAKARGLNENVIKKVEISGKGKAKISILHEKLSTMGLKKVIVIVPEYTSRRFHILFNSLKDDRVLYLIKPATVPYFNKDSWWKDGTSRLLLMKELCAIVSYHLERFKYGEKKEDKDKKG